MIEIKNLKNEKVTHPWDVRVDRMTPLGNPFFMSNEQWRNFVCDKYERYFEEKIASDTSLQRAVEHLIEIYRTYGKLSLFCWCAPNRCHAETLKRHIE